MADLLDYEMFVESKLSTHSTDFNTMIERLTELNEQGNKLGVRIPELLTAASGLAAESGEFIEIVKKMQFQGKPLNEANRLHLKKELGDTIFYALVACIALGYTADEVIGENREKLDKRFVKGFTVEESENRKEGDI